MDRRRRRPASASPEPSPSDSVDAPTPTAPADPPADKERNRVTVVAAADIDGNGKLDDLVTIESPPGTILRNVHAVPIPTDPAPPSGIFFPAGLFDYEVVVAKPGDPATVTFHLPDGTVKKDVDTGFWVLQNGRWSDLTARADADHVTDEVTVKLVDGGAGDQDRHADGVIADPGGPGVPGDDWTLTLTVRAPADPTATFNYFLEECTETSGTTPMHAPGPAPVGGLGRRGWPHPSRHRDHTGDAERRAVVHVGQPRRRPPLPLIEVGTASPPDTGTGSAPAGWAVTGFACESVGATLLESDDNSIVGYLSTIEARSSCPPPVGPTAPSPTAARRSLARAAPSRPARWATARASDRTSRSRARRWASGATSTATATSSPAAPTGRPSRRA